ncbi:hypothetical protein [Moorena sp. SIO1G6]|nr:hypothetical protein [Moorena sp. SIO1G6]
MGIWGIRSVFPIPDSRLPTPDSLYLFQILLLDWRYIENIAVIAP